MHFDGFRSSRLSRLGLSAFVISASLAAVAGCGGKSGETPASDGGTSDDGAVDAGPLDGSNQADADAGPDSGPEPVACSSGKVDLLFMIDNSASMGTKVDYLKVAVPDLIGRLAQPNCVAGGKVVGKSQNGACAQGTIEFPPVADLHVAVITSSLGTRGGDVCDPTAKIGQLSKHNDDRAHLINRGGADEHPVADMSASNFLAWAPGASGGAADPAKLMADFQDLLSGVHDLGCGIESPLESVYRFLVQPDPYDSIDTSSGTAKWVGVDQTILQQRHDFLRPDSTVIVVDVTDENDSEIDVRALGGQGYLWLNSSFPPPIASSACATNPADPNCTSCQVSNDPACKDGSGGIRKYPEAETDWGYNMNLRHVHMKQKYGLDVQFPIRRYADGLSKSKVPNRDGEYPAAAANYVGNANCTNPLFAASLPDGTVTDPAKLCSLPQGPRSNGQVFFAHIGGVPNQLLHIVPGDPTATALQDSDWVKLLGNDPERFDYGGIDPHMIESYQPRATLPGPTSSDTADPMNGREWITNATYSVDLELACTFPLLAPVDCTQASNMDTCDCPSSAGTPSSDLPPLCNPQNVTQQVRGKAYPTIRELQVAKALGTRGIVSSICPVHGTEMSPGDPLFGYRPAVTAIVDRVGLVLDKPCGK